MWINPLSDIMGGWWIWHTAADGTVTLTKSNVDQESIDAGTGRHIDCIDFLFYGSAFEI